MSNSSIVIVRQDVPDYNYDEYLQPWIGRVVRWDDLDVMPLLVFGGYTRTHPARRGSGGTLEIAAAPGSLLRWGQSSKHSTVSARFNWAKVRVDGTLQPLTLGQAATLWAGRAAGDDVEVGEYVRYSAH